MEAMINILMWVFILTGMLTWIGIGMTLVVIWMGLNHAGD